MSNQTSPAWGFSFHPFFWKMLIFTALMPRRGLVTSVFSLAWRGHFH
jgi:hypothetical protein